MNKKKLESNVLAVIVTYNRKNLLQRCIYNLKKQSYPNLEILVINNGSTDGTKEMLVNMKINFIEQQNLGAAKGWYEGLNYACKNNYEYCWLMDDDGYPDILALEKLVGNFSEGISCCSSTVLQEKNKKFFVFPYPKLNSKGFPVLFDFNRKYTSIIDLKKNYDLKIYPYAHFFNGALIKVEAVKVIGEIKTNLVIFGEELDYYYRLKKFGKVITILDAFHYHPNVKLRPYTKDKIFYYIRNSMYINSTYLDISLVRNILTIVVIIIRIIRRNGIIELLKLLFCIDTSLFYLAIYYGFKKKIN